MNFEIYEDKLRSKKRNKLYETFKKMRIEDTFF